VIGVVTVVDVPGDRFDAGACPGFAATGGVGNAWLPPPGAVGVAAPGVTAADGAGVCPGFVPTGGIGNAWLPPRGAVGVAAPGVTAADGDAGGFAPAGVPGVATPGAGVAAPGVTTAGRGWLGVPGSAAGLAAGFGAPGAPPPCGFRVCKAALCATEGGSDGPMAAAGGGAAPAGPPSAGAAAWAGG
jgi:hypothetical protein